MRRIAALLIVLATIGLIGFSLSRGPRDERGGDSVQASDERRKERGDSDDSRSPQHSPTPLAAHDLGPFALPPDADAEELVDFVRQIHDAAPIGDARQDDPEYEEFAPLAIRAACEQILRLETDRNAAAFHFAQRELLALDVRLLPFVEDPQVRRAAIERLRGVILSRPSTVEDAELAIDLAAMCEDLEDQAFLRPLLDRLAAHYESNDNAETARRGRLLRGARRRLDLVGRPLELNGLTDDGRVFSLSAWKGKVVVVDFCADWSGENREEWSNLKRNYLAYHDAGLEVVSINLAASREHLVESLAEHRPAWTTLYDDEQRQYHPAAVELGILAPPRRLLIDQQGRVVSTDVRGRHLRRQLRKLLGAPRETLAGPFGYPAFNTGEVIERLCDAGEELLAQGGYTASTTLRPDLARRSCKLELPAASTEPLDDEALFRRLTESVFVIGTLYKGPESEEFDLSLATAFAVTPDGVLSTSYHVFDDDPEALVTLAMDAKGQTFPVEEILAADQAADTCLLRVRAAGLKPLPYGADASPGARARIVSHPGDSFYYFTSGHVSNYEKDDDGVVWMNVTAEFAQGSSGGPVVDACGNVIGQVSRTATMYAGDPLDPAEEKPPLHGSPPRQHHRRGAPPSTPPVPEIPAWMEPQMTFRTCVPAVNLKRLVEQPR